MKHLFYSSKIQAFWQEWSPS